jgi:hypothetical protein
VIADNTVLLNSRFFRKKINAAKAGALSGGGLISSQMRPRSQRTEAQYGQNFEAADPYPFCSLDSSAWGSGRCDWSFGTVVPGVTTSALGGDAQYGTPDVARYGGTIISTVQINPQTAGPRAFTVERCAAPR